MRQDKVLLAFSVEGRHIKIDWERLKQLNIPNYAHWVELADKPFFLNEKMSKDILQIEYDKIEELFNKITGLPH
jgi:hypothetical protein